MNFRDYAPDDLREISRRAGIASGVARREKRAAIEREKVSNIALREQHLENIQTIRQAILILLKARRSFDQAKEVSDRTPQSC